MGVHRETGNRVRGKENSGDSPDKRQRVEAICKQCGEPWYFYRYPKRRRPEYDVCADCGVKNYLKEHRIPVP